MQITPRRDLVLPAGDTLFTSGTLGRFSPMLNDVQGFQNRTETELNQTAAD